MKLNKGKHGGTLKSMEKGDPALPNAGRPRTKLFRAELLKQIGERPKELPSIVKGLLDSAKKRSITHIKEVREVLDGRSAIELNELSEDDRISKIIVEFKE